MPETDPLSVIRPACFLRVGMNAWQDSECGQKTTVCSFHDTAAATIEMLTTVLRSDLNKKVAVIDDSV